MNDPEGSWKVRIDCIWLPTQVPSVLNLRPLSTPCLHKSSIASGVVFKGGNSIGWTAWPSPFVQFSTSLV